MKRKLSKKKAIKKAIRMWKWIAKETRRTQRIIEPNEYFDFRGIDTSERPWCNSYLCEYDKSVSAGVEECYQCPVSIWAGTYLGCQSNTNYYWWLRDENPDFVALMAERIVDMLKSEGCK